MGWSTALSAHSKSQRKLGPGGKVDLLLSTRTAGKPILWMAGQPALVTAVSLISSRWRDGETSVTQSVRTAGQLLFPGSERGRALTAEPLVLFPKSALVQTLLSKRVFASGQSEWTSWRRGLC